MIKSPFPHLIKENFLNKEQVKQLLQAVRTIKFTKKESDLFTFLQSKDLNNSTNKVIKDFIQTLQSQEWQEFIKEETNLKISKKIDISATIYQPTHHLLPHDDRLEGRKIAFFFYLTSMNKKTGGALCLYNNNKVTKRIYPKAGTFACFEVSKKSIHSVQEVIAEERIALSGWFHD